MEHLVDDAEPAALRHHDEHPVEVAEGQLAQLQKIMWSNNCYHKTNFVIIIFVVNNEIMILFLTVRSRNTPVTVKDMRRSVAKVKSRVKLLMSCCK